MDKKILAARWIVLDNLKNGWPPSTNLSREFWEPALEWAKRQGYVDGNVPPIPLDLLLAKE